MNANAMLSRRSVLGSFAVSPVLASTGVSAEAPCADAELVALGRQLDSIPAALDRASEHDEAMALLEKIDTLSAAIVATPAKTLQGLYVKAHATAWALRGDFAGDFDPMDESSNNDRVAASLVRDLLELGATHA